MMSLWGRKRVLDPASKIGIKAWLGSIAVRLVNVDPKMATRSGNAIVRLRTGDFEEAEKLMQMMRTAYKQAEENGPLTHAQLAEDCMLKVFLEELGKL